MDNIMIGDLVMLIRRVEHPELGAIPSYTLATALYKHSGDAWVLGVTGFGQAIVPRDAFRLYEEKSVLRLEEARRRDMRLTGDDDGRD